MEKSPHRGTSRHVTSAKHRQRATTCIAECTPRRGVRRRRPLEPVTNTEAGCTKRCRTRGSSPAAGVPAPATRLALLPALIACVGEIMFARIGAAAVAPQSLTRRDEADETDKAVTECPSPTTFIHRGSALSEYQDGG